MCGIVGILSERAEMRDPALAERMATAIAHRGPDDSGVYTSGPITLGFRRLSVLDLAAGHQPMVSQNSRYTITFNGEIYNFRELRKELEREHQRQFLTRCDSEVVLQAFEVWGTESFARFNGMFAIAVWDNVERQLYLARDRSGKKPLFTYVAGDRSCILFASEVKALRAHPVFSAQPDLARIASSAAYRYAPGQETLFAGVNALPAGHWAVLETGGDYAVESQPYWENPVCFDGDSDDGKKNLRRISNTKNAIAELRETLTASIRRRLVADVPVGAFLSGGIDSSLIVALMAKEIGSSLNTFSIGFDTGFSEHNYARTVADKFSTAHHETIVSADDLLKEIPAVLWHRETPISEPSDIPLYMLSREARRRVTVVLSGEGSDELFAGYPKYVAEYYLSRWPNRMIRGLVPMARKFLGAPAARRPRVRSALASLAERDHFDSMARWFGAFGSDERARLFMPALAEHVEKIHSFARQVAADCPDRHDKLTAMQLQDFAHWLPANLLLRGDRVSMAHSLELRCPFLDPDLIDFAFGRLPDSMKIRRGSGKWIVRQMARDILPDEIIERKKWGFKVPVAEWFRGPLKPALEQVLLSGRASGRGYFHVSDVQRIISEHTDHGADHSKQLWYLFQLELWHLMFIDGELKVGDALS